MMTHRKLFRRTGKYGGRWEIEFGIPPGARVLDIGGGDRPYPRATDVVDLDTTAAETQRSGRKMDKSKIVHLGRAEDVLPTFMFRPHVRGAHGHGAIDVQFGQRVTQVFAS